MERVVLALAEALWPKLPLDDPTVISSQRSGGTNEQQRPHQQSQGSASDLDQRNRALAEYLSTSGADCPHLLPHVLSVLDNRLHGALQRQLKLLLQLLAYRLPTALVAGQHCLSSSWPFVQAVPEMSVRQRQAMLISWRHSWLPPLRKAYKGIKSVLSAVLLSHVDPATGTNPFHAGLGFQPGTAAHAAAAGPPHASAAANEDVLASATQHLPQVLQCSGSAGAAQALLAKRGFHTNPATADSAAKHHSSSNGSSNGVSHGVTNGVSNVTSSSNGAAAAGDGGSIQLWYDAVVVGSGAGGGVTAAVLAAAGLKVLVLEKGSWVRAADMTWRENQAFEEMYERAGFMITRDGGLTLLAGATLGGGTKINWTASLAPPHHVRAEWAAPPHGLACLGPDSASFDASLQAVCGRLGVCANTQLSTPNTKLLQGMHALGLHAEPYPRNCLSRTCTAFCNLGCRSGHKQSSEVWLVDAVRAGAHVLTGVDVQRVLTAPQQAEPGSSRSQRAVGVLARASAPSSSSSSGQPLPPPARLVVHAPIVVASCGAVHTPALLLRSGIRGGFQVGANLRVHPATGVVAVFPQTDAQRAAGAGAVNMYEGVSMAVYSTAASHREGAGYGALLSVPACQPGLLAALTPDAGGPGSMKRLLLQLPNCSLVVVFTRDSSGGRVSIDGQGRPLVDYWPCAATREHLLEGVVTAVRAMVAAGACQVIVPNMAEDWHLHLAPDDSAEQRQQKLDALVATMQATGVRKYDMPLFSAHQMGSCRMGTSRRTSSCDAHGEVWDVSGLYVADGSTFPTPSGVNPMISIYGISHQTAKGIAQRWKARRVANGVAASRHAAQAGKAATRL